MSRLRQVVRAAIPVMRAAWLAAMLGTAIAALLTRDDPALGIALIALAGSLAVMWREPRRS